MDDRDPPPPGGPTAAARPGRFWATLSLIAGGLWLFLSVTPFFITTLLGLPFAALAFLTGWRDRRSPDRVAARRAGWGLGLGCAGCLWQVLYYTLVAGALVAAAPSLVDYLRQALGTPTP